MNLSALILEYNPALTTLAIDWESRALRIEILAAASDNHLGPDERMLFGLRAQLIGDPESVEGTLRELEQRVQDEGFDEVCADELETLESARNALSKEVGPELAHAVGHALLARVLEVVKADRKLTHGERAFVLEHVAPALALSEATAEEQLQASAESLERRHRITRVLYGASILLYDADIPPEGAEEAFGVELPGALGQLSQLITEHELGSPSSVGYFLAKLGGVSFMSELERLGTTLASWAEEERGQVGELGLERHLEALSGGLDERDVLLLHAELPPWLTIADPLSQPQRKLLRDKVLPAFGVRVDALDDVATRLRRVNPKFYNNLIGEKRWWEFWR